MIVTLCEFCGVEIGKPHILLPTDCVIGHTGHSERFVGLLCRRHYHWISDTLAQITELYALRGSVLLPGAGGDSGIGHLKTIHSPAPGRLEVMALTDRRARDWREDPEAIPNPAFTLTSWCELIVEEHDASPPAPDGTLTGAVSFLRSDRRWIAQQAWIDDYVNDLGGLHQALARAVGDSMWPRSIGKCPNCQTRLYNTIGVDSVTCRRCKTSWEGVHLARLRLVHEQEARKA